MIDSIKTSSYLENLFGVFKSGVNCSVKEMQVYAWFLISSSECNFLQKVILRICVVTLSFLSLSRPQLVFVLKDLINTYLGDVSYTASNCYIVFILSRFSNRNSCLNHKISNDFRLNQIMSFKWKNIDCSNQKSSKRKKMSVCDYKNSISRYETLQ